MLKSWVKHGRRAAGALQAHGKATENPTPVELPSGNFRCQVTVNGERADAIHEDPRVAHAEALALRAKLKEIKREPEKKTVKSAIDDYIKSKSNTLSLSTIGGYRAIQRTRFQSAMQMNIYDVTEDLWQELCN